MVGPKIRSSVRVRQSEKRHFSDPSLACAPLGATPESLLADLETLRFLFEALCVRDLKVYAEANDAKVFHYQDYNNNEIDAVVEMPDGSWGAFEIKLGANQIDNAAKTSYELRQALSKTLRENLQRSFVLYVDYPMQHMFALMVCTLFRLLL